MNSATGQIPIASVRCDIPNAVVSVVIEFTIDRGHSRAGTARPSNLKRVVAVVVETAIHTYPTGPAITVRIACTDATEWRCRHADIVHSVVRTTGSVREENMAPSTKRRPGDRRHIASRQKSARSICAKDVDRVVRRSCFDVQFNLRSRRVCTSRKDVDSYMVV